MSRLGRSSLKARPNVGKIYQQALRQEEQFRARHTKLPTYHLSGGRFGPDNIQFRGGVAWLIDNKFTDRDEVWIKPHDIQSISSQVRRIRKQGVNAGLAIEMWFRRRRMRRLIRFKDVDDIPSDRTLKVWVTDKTIRSEWVKGRRG